MRPRFFQSLRSRFVVSFLAMVVVACGLVQLNHTSEERFLAALAQEQVEEDTLHRAGRLAAILAVRTSDVSTAASDPDVVIALSEGSTESARLELERMLHAMPQVAGACLVDQGYRPVVALGLNACDELTPGARFVTRYGHSLISVTVDVGGGKGMLTALIRGEVAMKVLSTAEFADVPIRLEVFDGQGRGVMASRPQPDANARLLTSVAPIPGYPYSLLAELEVERVEALSDRNFRQHVASSLAALAGMGLVIFFIARSVSKPLRSMTETTRAIADGHFEVRVPLSGPTEAQRLCAAINRMAAELETHYRELERECDTLADEVRLRNRELSAALDRAQGLQKVAERQTEELKAQNETLQAQAAELVLHEQQLHQRNEVLVENNARLQEAARLKSEFVANMSHELRTPLNAVISFSDILLDGMSGPLTAEQREYVDDIHQAGRHLLSMVNDILDLAKVEAGKLTLACVHLPLALPAREAELMVRPLADRKKLALQLSLDHGVYVRGDGVRLRQIALNLLSNAVKFTPAGGQVTLTVRHSRDGRRAELEVSDTGIGIDPAHHRTVFEAFRQLDGSPTRAYEGTGLGLSLVQKFASAMGGVVLIDSALGKGARFTLQLPVSSETGSSSAAA